MWYDYPKIRALGIDIPNMIGKYLYTFKSPKGKVSMIRYNDYDYDNERKWRWEIYSHEELFEDVERYDTWKQVRERIKQVLSPDLNW